MRQGLQHDRSMPGFCFEAPPAAAPDADAGLRCDLGFPFLRVRRFSVMMPQHYSRPMGMAVRTVSVLGTRKTIVLAGRASTGDSALMSPSTGKL